MLLFWRAEDILRSPLANAERRGVHVVEKPKFCQRRTHVVRSLGVPESENAVIMEIRRPRLEPPR